MCRPTPDTPIRHIRLSTMLSVRCPTGVKSPKLTSVGIIAIFLRLAPGRGHHDICIKIPGTWEGLEASRTLREEHYRVLVTTVFGIEQASLAAAVGSTYIAPYVNELKVHFNQEFVKLLIASEESC